ncbi:MAG: hypothetical protein QM765_14845 [Myxococcales bacterium]
MKLRFARRPRWFLNPRGITPQRLAAAKKRLRLEQEAAPLFAKQIAAQQPTPEERITRSDAGAVESEREARRSTARLWREARALLRAMPAANREAILLHWNKCWTGPLRPEYLLCEVKGQSSSAGFLATPPRCSQGDLCFHIGRQCQLAWDGHLGFKVAERRLSP